MAKLSAASLYCSVSNDPSEIILICWFGAQIIFIIINIERVVLFNIFVEVVIFLKNNFWLIEHLKEQHLFKI